MEGNAITWLFDKKTLPCSAKTPAVTQEKQEKASPKQQQTEKKHSSKVRQAFVTMIKQVKLQSWC